MTRMLIMAVHEDAFIDAARALSSGDPGVTALWAQTPEAAEKALPECAVIAADTEFLLRHAKWLKDTLPQQTIVLWLQ